MENIVPRSVPISHSIIRQFREGGAGGKNPPAEGKSRGMGYPPACRPGEAYVIGMLSGNAGLDQKFLQKDPGLIHLARISGEILQPMFCIPENFPLL